MDKIDYAESLPHQNLISAVVWDYASMRKTAIAEMEKNLLSPKNGLTLALKLSVDSPNLDRMTPIKREDGSMFTNIEAKKMFSGDKNKKETLTVSRYCAVLSAEIRRYLKVHPTECWNQTAAPGCRAELCFPHNYYVPNLSADERNECVMFLLHMDEIMTKALQDKWRSLSYKAALYFKRKYGDTVIITGDKFKITHKN